MIADDFDDPLPDWDPENTLYISQATVWELAIKLRLKNRAFPPRLMHGSWTDAGSSPASRRSLRPDTYCPGGGRRLAGAEFERTVGRLPGSKDLVADQLTGIVSRLHSCLVWKRGRGARNLPKGFAPARFLMLTSRLRHAGMASQRRLRDGFGVGPRGCSSRYNRASFLPSAWRQGLRVLRSHAL